ncbi:hypothetical protein [Pseudonocardia sp.]|uniref:hypothetical protein n=1 Tax=Pseudonocardia sp. TaxID=60912 RepID=UPI003D13506F
MRDVSDVTTVPPGTPPRSRPAPLLVGRAVALAVLTAALVLYLTGVVSVPQLLTALVIVLLALLVLVVRPADVRALLGRVQQVSAGGVSIELAAAGAKAAAAAPTGSEDDPDGDPTSIVELRFRLERKLADLARGVLSEVVGGIVVPTHVTIGGLVRDRLLGPAEATVADTILTTSEHEFAAYADTQRSALLRDGGRFVATFRAAVFQARAAQLLAQQAGGVERVRRDDAAGDDLVVTGAGGRLRYVPVFADAGSDLVRRQQQRAALLPGRSVVLVPALSPSPPPGDAQVPVRTFGDLLRGP